MITAELDATTHDITWRKLTGDDAIRQSVRCEVRCVLGEWFLDLGKGIPWMRQPNASATPILGVLPADLAYAEALVKAAILSVPGVSSIKSFALRFNHTTRAALCAAEIVTTTGGTFSLSEATP